MSEGYLPDPIWRDRLPKMWSWMRNFQVNGAAGFSNNEDYISISIPAFPASSFVDPAADLPKGEFDGMTYGMVSDNEAGFSFQRIVNVPPGF